MLAALVLSGSAVAQAPDPDAPYILYLHSDASRVDHEAMARLFIDQGHDVTTFWLDRDDPVASSRAVSRRVKQLIRDGVSPDRINVIGSGPTSTVAALTSGGVANMRVNYVLLGQCDPAIRQQFHFTMSGRVIGIYDEADDSSLTCRALWNGSPRVSDRKQLVTSTGLGESLFDRPHEAWTNPVMAWVLPGGVNVGEIRVSKSQRQLRSKGSLAVVDLRGK
ncbi:MAG: hypothetical protein A3E01_00425 [Gammaproteobacteria bacterium RIFCSPHIGHO2_12_FULL_63_22]|nr:MAG: hypothetical protein A3E01_00425 [Gammaproteobacteria bacterium RIFCSPHIGHO2_12_FULL_63_22]